MSDLQLQFKNLLRKYGMLEDFTFMVEKSFQCDIQKYLEETAPERFLPCAFVWENHPNGRRYWHGVHNDWLNTLASIERSIELEDE